MTIDNEVKLLRECIPTSSTLPSQLSYFFLILIDLLRSKLVDEHIICYIHDASMGNPEASKYRAGFNPKKIGLSREPSTIVKSTYPFVEKLFGSVLLRTWLYEEV